MTRLDIHVLVGAIMLVLFGGLVYLSTHRGQVDLLDVWDFTIHAQFSTVGGLQEGAPVELAGVTVGRVDSMTLVGRQARITMSLRRGLPLHEDARAKIKAKGIIGERYVALSPESRGKQLIAGGEIRRTEPPVNVLELLSQVFLDAGAGNAISPAL